MKIINKIIGVILGATMAAGIGIGVWGGHKDFTPVYAETNTYTKVSTLTEGDSVLITTEKNGVNYYLPTSNGSSSAPAASTVTISNNTITADLDAHLFILVKDGDNWKFKNGNNYLYSTNTNNGIRIGSNANNIYTVTATTNGYKMQNVATSRFVGVYNTQDWRCYNTSNASNYGGSGEKINFYKASAITPPTPIDPPELDHAGTLADPYSVADSRALIDYAAPEEQVYVKGIVHKAYDYNTTYNNITFFFSDDGTETDDMEAYRCVGTDAENIEVGDTVILYGILMKYNSTYELAEGCELISLIKPQSDNVSAWCVSFLATITCDGGTTPPSVSAWGQMKTAFLALDSADQLTLASLNNDATARYDYIIGKYGANAYEDFLNRNPAPLASSMRMFFNTPEQTTSFAIIIIVSAIMIAVVGTWLILKKKKQLN